MSRTIYGLRGWTHVEVPSGWVQVLCSARPPSVQWPAENSKFQQERRSSAVQQVARVPHVRRRGTSHLFPAAPQRLDGRSREDLPCPGFHRSRRGRRSRRSFFLDTKEMKTQSSSVKTVLPRHLRGMAFHRLCDTTCRDHWVRPTTQRKTQHTPSQASVSTSAPKQGRQRAPEGWVIPVPCAVPIARRSLRLPHSIGPLSRWQRPEVGTASHSGALSLSHLAWNRTAPSFSAAPGCGSPEPHNALRSVTSTANWGPLKQGRSCAKTSMRLSSSTRTPRFMSLKNALYSPGHQLRGKFGHHVLCRGGPLPNWTRSCACGSMSSVCVERFRANSLRDRQRQVQPLQEQHSEQMRGHCALRCRRCVCKHNPSVQTRVRSQMRLARADGQSASSSS